ncbi:hypothetical protein POM88_024001 [Heracleum sosnowskyi]|uniref:Uncharacterized protein n=1 Tax=Heracleum sosnowskyi TaxID=360622 RepID=A0AAD8MUY8_9APIA|nr:hypothetical protein POM88_024001 [Heracleum sosnowskyi]
MYIHLADFPDWISRRSSSKSKMTLDLPKNGLHSFLAMILCFKHLEYANFYRTTYSVKNTTSGLILSGSFNNFSHEAQIKIVPKAIFTVSDGDDSIELTSGNADILGIHLVYENELR